MDKKNTQTKLKPGKDFIGVGCGAMILNENNEILLLKRKDNAKVFPGQWSRPGGTVEFGEEIEDAIKREVKEEIGVDIKIISFLHFCNHLLADGQHWVTIGYLAKIINGEAENKEPDKHEEIKWFPLNNLPKNIAEYTGIGVDIYLNNFKSLNK